MDAFSKFFQKRPFSLGNTIKGCNNESKTRSEATFGKDSVQLFVYRDHDLKGRKLLFDSKSMCRHGESQKSGCCRRKGKDNSSSSDTGQPPTDVKASAKHTMIKDSSESSMVAEMMFGAVAMAYKGPTLKVHTIRTPPQVMITKIFVPVQQPVKDTSLNEGEFDSCSYQSGSSSVVTADGSVSLGSVPTSGPCSAPALLAHSVPVPVPSPTPPRSLDNLPIAETGDSGIMDSGPSSQSSHTTPFPSPSSSSTSSSSYIHRIRRNRNTSLEISINTKRGDASLDKPLPASKRPPQIGIGIVFNMPEGQEEKTKHFQNFVFSHITLIEGHVNRMGLIIEKSRKSKPHFQNATIEALEQFTESLFSLYLGPRLKEPVWLSMMASPTRKGELCTTFLKELMYLVEKHHKFVSCLVTAVLTQHLAWVPTVAPAGGTPSRTYLDKHSAKWLDALAKSHPYNPLWAQLSDLYGAIGFPLKLSRTVVVGRKQEVIRRLLHVLSYFIRCSEVFEAVEEPEQCHLDGLEAQACTQEIMIPCHAPREDGSVRSAGSLFMQGSTLSCSNCGSVIENPLRGGGRHQDNSTTNSPAPRQLQFRSPPPTHDDNYFEFGQKRTLKSPPALFEENHFDFTTTKPALKSPPPGQEQLVFQFEKSKSFVQPADHTEVPGESHSTQELQLVNGCPITNNMPILEMPSQLLQSQENTTTGLCSRSDEADLLLSKEDEEVCSITPTSGYTSGVLEACEAAGGRYECSVSGESEDLQAAAGMPECEGGRLRHRCALLFTVVEGEEGSDQAGDLVSRHTPDKHPSHTEDNTPTHSPESHHTTIPLNCDEECSAPTPANVMQVTGLNKEESAEAGNTESCGEHQSPKVKALGRTQSESGVPTHTQPALNIPRHHSDTTFPHTKAPLEQNLCINGKLKYKIRDNLYPDLTSLKVQEGLQTPEDQPEVLFPVPVEPKEKSHHSGLEGSQRSVCQKQVLHRVKLGERSDKNIHPSVNQIQPKSFSEEPKLEVKIQRERHVGKQSIDDVCSELCSSNLVNPNVKTISRDSGIEECFERSEDRVKALCLDSGVYDDFVFKSDERTSSMDRKNCKKMLKLDDRTRMVLRSFSSDSQNSFSEYENVGVPHPLELESVVTKRVVEGRPVLQRLVSEGTVSLFDEYFEGGPVGEVPLFGGDEEALSEQNTISESVDGERALSVGSGEATMDTQFHTRCQDQLPQEVDKSVLFDRISHHPGTCEPLTSGLGPGEEGEHQHRGTPCWEEGVRRRELYDDMCSSITDSDVTDLEGSLCSECTLKADRAGAPATGRHRRHIYKRQSSIPSTTGTPGRTSTPGRTRSVTPTELNRRRHASTLSSSTQEALDSDGQTPTVSSLEHMVMPSFLTGEDVVVPAERNFGHSLLAGFSPHYLSDFTLHGTSDQNFHTRLHQDLRLAVQNPVLDESITEAACVVADSDKWNVKVLSCHYNNSDRVKTQEVAASKIICDIIDSVYHLWKLKMSPEFCLMHLEDRLQEVYFKSKMLSEYLRFHRKIDLKELAAMLGFDSTDLPLLLAVAGTHTPYFSLGLLS